MSELREQLYEEVKNDSPYMKKIREWLRTNSKEEFSTNLHDLVISDEKVYIYSCLNGKLSPDILSIEEFDSLISSWLIKNKDTIKK